MLYFVSTPIGNLKDITLRALEVLKNVDVIACEDTRNSLKLLNHYDIHKKLIAYHKFNEKNSSDGIIALLNEGKNVAVISDAGMPVISDPGQTLIEKLKQNNLEYTVVPGANAGLCALLLSGLDSTKFTFIGFVPDDKKQREKLLNEVKEYKSTLIFYVAPHDVTEIVKQLHESFGTRKACLVNEITKMFEKTFDFELSQNFEFDAKGEYVLVVEGNKQEEQNDFASMSIKEHLLYYINLGEDKNSAIKKVAKQRGLPKNEVYQVATQI